jgi:hypothetical protein
MKKTIFAFLLILGSYQTRVISQPSPGVENITISGQLVLISYPHHRYPDGSCGGEIGGGYQDIQPGLTVVIRDGSNNIIGMGKLSPGKIEEGVSCVFPYRIAGVPKTNFYSIEIGRRGSVNYSYQDLVENNFYVETMLSRY